MEAKKGSVAATGDVSYKGVGAVGVGIVISNAY